MPATDKADDAQEQIAQLRLHVVHGMRQCLR